jgi:transposase InsO family protein
LINGSTEDLQFFEAHAREFNNWLAKTNNENDWTVHLAQWVQKDSVAHNILKNMDSAFDTPTKFFKMVSSHKEKRGETHEAFTSFQGKIHKDLATQKPLLIHLKEFTDDSKLLLESVNTEKISVEGVNDEQKNDIIGKFITQYLERKGNDMICCLVPKAYLLALNGEKNKAAGEFEARELAHLFEVRYPENDFRMPMNETAQSMLPKKAKDAVVEKDRKGQPKHVLLKDPVKDKQYYELQKQLEVAKAENRTLKRGSETAPRGQRPDWNNNNNNNKIAKNFGNNRGGHAQDTGRGNQQQNQPTGRGNGPNRGNERPGDANNAPYVLLDSSLTLNNNQSFEHLCTANDEISELDGKNKGRSVPKDLGEGPGGGLRPKLISTCTDFCANSNNLGEAEEEVIINSWLDCGSSTSLISNKFVNLNKIKKFRSLVPTKLSGVFGSSSVKYLDICWVELVNGPCKFVIPAYVIDEFPSGAEMLIGMDQIGPKKAIGLIASFDSEDINVNIKTLDQQIFAIRLSPSEEEGAFVNNIHETPSHVSNTYPRVISNHKDRENICDDKQSNMVNLMAQHDLLEVKEGPSKYTNQLEKILEKTRGSKDLLQGIALKKRMSIQAARLETQAKTAELAKLESKELIGKLRNDLTTNTNELREATNHRLGRSKASDLRTANTELLERIHEEELYFEELLRAEKEISRRIKTLRNRQDKDIHSRLKRSKNESMKNALRSSKRYNSNDAESTGEIKDPIDLLLRVSQNCPILFGADQNSKEEVSKIVCALADRTANDEICEEVINLISLGAFSPPGETSEFATPFEEAVERETIISRPLNSTEVTSLQELTGQFPHVLVANDSEISFGTATLNGQECLFDIELKPGGAERLSKIKKKPYPMKTPQLDMLRDLIKNYQDTGIGDLDPPLWETEYASPSFFAYQKGKYRFCNDYKDLNKETVESVYPIPNMETIHKQLAGKKFISIVDLKSAFHQFGLTDRAKRLLATITPLGNIRYNCLSFGPRNGPSFFQNKMNIIFANYIGKFMFVYIDDLIVYSNTFEEHLEHLRKIFETLAECNLMTNINKCHFCVKEVKILGKIISEKGIGADPELIKAMLEFPRPETKAKLRSFLAMVGHYRHYIKDFRLIAEPLFQMLKDIKPNKLEWGEEESRVFNNLKGRMTETPILAYPDFKKPFYIQSDASAVGAGAVLYQLNDEKLPNAVAYGSWKFDSAQTRYTATEREMLGIMLSIRKWKPYFWGRDFVIETDHQPLAGVLKLDDPHGRIARWASELQQFNASIIYIKGIDNIFGDPLSRVHETTATVEEILMFELIEETRFSEALSEAISEDHIIDEIETKDKIEKCLLLLSFGHPTDKEWKAALFQDPESKGLLLYLSDKELPANKTKAKMIVSASKNFIVINDILYKREKAIFGTKISNHGATTIDRKYVPRSYRKLVLAECHDSLWAGGHMGRDKTLVKVREKYYFPDLENYVRMYVRTCTICNRTKRVHPHKHLPQMGEIRAFRPFELLCIDIWDPQVTSKNGNKKVLTIVDAYSKFAWGIPLVDETAETVALALFERLLTSFPCPETIHSDKGPSLVGKIITHLCDLLGVNRTSTTAYNPRGNGIAERIHQFFKNAITAYINKDQDDWDFILPLIVKIYNDAVHESLGNLTPSEVVFGRRLGDVIAPNENLSSPKLFNQRLTLALARAQEIVLDRHIYKDARKMIKSAFQPDPIIIEPGDKVGLRVEKLPQDWESSKLFPRFQGPYTVSRVTHNGGVVYLNDPFTGIEEKTPYSARRIKIFHSRKDAGISDSEDTDNSENELEEEKEDSQIDKGTESTGDDIIIENPITDVAPLGINPGLSNNVSSYSGRVRKANPKYT